MKNEIQPEPFWIGQYVQDILATRRGRICLPVAVFSLSIIPFTSGLRTVLLGLTAQLCVGLACRAGLEIPHHRHREELKALNAEITAKIERFQGQLESPPEELHLDLDLEIEIDATCGCGTRMVKKGPLEWVCPKDHWYLRWIGRGHAHLIGSASRLRSGTSLPVLPVLPKKHVN